MLPKKTEKRLLSAIERRVLSVGPARANDGSRQVQSRAERHAQSVQRCRLHQATIERMSDPRGQRRMMMGVRRKGGREPAGGTMSEKIRTIFSG